jgi:hypothetical protein
MKLFCWLPGRVPTSRARCDLTVPIDILRPCDHSEKAEYAGTLEIVFERELNDARVGRSADLSEEWAGKRAVGIGEIDIVEEVEELGAELEKRFFEDRYVFEGGEVGVDGSGADQRVSAGIAVGDVGRNLSEGGGVEELMDFVGPASSSTEQGIADGVWTIGKDAVQVGVDTRGNGEGGAGTKRGDSIQLPVAEDIFADEAVPMDGGCAPKIRRNEALRHIVV